MVPDTGDFLRKEPNASIAGMRSPARGCVVAHQAAEAQSPDWVESVQVEVDLNDVLASALQQLKATIRAGKAKVSHVGPEEACIVRGDAVQLKMVFVNVIQNALDAVANSRRKRKEIIIESIIRNGTVEIVIGDSGPGWPGGTLDEMLLNTSKPGGSGIGLYVVKTAVENHRGQIVIGRSPLGGAEFRITLPPPHARDCLNYPSPA